MSTYKLSSSLIGHEDDIKNLAKVSDNQIVSVARDCTLRNWVRDDNDIHSWHQNLLYKDLKYLNSVAYGDGEIVFGGQTGNVLKLNTNSISGNEDAAKDNTITIGNHASNVCSLSIDYNQIVSGSWDSTAKVWDLKGNLLHTLKGHESSVWAVLIFSSTTIITASADRNIIIWENGVQKQIIKSAHDDAIRGLCKINDSTFASCSNDSLIKIWDINNPHSHPIQILTGHSSFIYSISCFNNILVSGGEDRSIRVWDLSSFECIQVITLPCTSVWSVVSLNDTDIVCGGSDNIIRVFSNSPSRYASIDEIKHLEQAVASTGVGQDQTGGKIDESQISSGDVLTKPGKKEGQVVMVRTGGPGTAIEAHQWTTGIWIKIGEVVQSASSGGKKVLYEGQEYDYVFDVDIREGSPPLKLPYNITQNPYEVALKFVEKYELSSGYVDDVAKFLIANTETVDLTSQPVQDPYAPNRYIPGGGGSTISGSGGNASTSNAHTSTLPEDLKIIPFTEVVSLISFTPDPIIKALSKNNEKYPNKLTPEELQILESSLKSGITPDSAQELFRYFIKLEQVWSKDDLLPALDILRIIIPSISKPSASIIQTIFSNMDPSSIKTTLLSTRVLVNLFSTGSGLKLALNPQVQENAIELLSTIIKSNQSTKPLNLAIASLLLNYSSKATNPNAAFEILTTIGLFKNTTSPLDSETTYRLLLALGTILTNPATSSPTIKDAALNLDLLTWSNTISQQFQEQRITDLLSELSRVLA